MMQVSPIPYEALARLPAFTLILALLVIWEHCAPLVRHRAPRAGRWPANLGMGILDVIVLRLLFPAGAVGAALLAAHHDIGVFNLLGWTGCATVIASIVVLDLVIYLQHRIFHAVPWLWRIHRVHHADPQLDVSTALRFHPLESTLSMLFKVGVVLALGMPAIAVLIFEIILNGAAMFNHANASLPRRIEPWIRCILVTPDMHRIHHSTSPAEAHRNFGFSVSWWDRLLGSYRAPRAIPAAVSIGLPDGPAESWHTRLRSLLLMPFSR